MFFVHEASSSLRHVGRTCRVASRGILIFTNFFFLLLGIILIFLGAYMIDIPDLNAFTEGGIPSAVIVCGFLILLIGCLGFCGAQWDSKMFLCPYATLVVISLIAMISLVAFTSHVHTALVNANENNFDFSELSSRDTKVLKWIHHRFEDVYDDCGLHVDVQMSLENKGLVAQCSDPNLNWFADFVGSKCQIQAQDLIPGSSFLQCAHKSSLDGSFDELTVLCSCETNLIEWVGEQSYMIVAVISTIIVFEILLVAVSCYLMCTRPRRYGYQEIRMPVKEQGYNAHPRNFYYQTNDNSFGQPIYNNSQGGMSYVNRGQGKGAYGEKQPLQH